MKKNIGAADRVVRLCVAALVVFLAATPSVNGWLAYAFYGAGAYLLITSLVGHCLIYRVLDIDSHEHGGEYHSGHDPFDGRAGN